MLTKEHFKKFRQNPVIYFTKVLGVKRLEEFQKKILKAIPYNNKIAIRATHSVGKTFLMGRIPLWFLSCFKNSKIITTAPTYRQVVKLLWGELRSAHKNARFKIGGHLTTNELKFSDDWYAIGFSPKKESESDSQQGQKGSTFQGFHAMHMMIIFDEATGIPPDIWKMAEGLMTSGKTIIFICIGNPTSRNSQFYNMFKMPTVKKFHLSCFDSPNLIANGFNTKKDIEKELQVLSKLTDYDKITRIKNYKKPVPYLLSADWVITNLLEWGMEHVLSKTKIFGEFPEDDDNCIVKLSEVENAIARDYEIKSEDKRFIGIDVARFGTDLTVFTEIIGNKVESLARHKKSDVNNTTEEAAAFILKNQRKTYVIIDGTGVGGGVVDNLREMKRKSELRNNVHIIEINFAQNCKSEKDKKHYVNIKSKIFVELGKDLAQNLDIPDESIYLKELPSILYTYKKGKMQMESKEDYKKRTGLPSPDHSDSLAIANYGRRNYMMPWFDKKEEQKEQPKKINPTTISSKYKW